MTSRRFFLHIGVGFSVGMMWLGFSAPVRAQQELKSFLALLAGKKVVLRQSAAALSQRAVGDLRVSLALDLTTLDEREIAALSQQMGYFVIPAEYTFLPFSERSYDKKTDTLTLQLTAPMPPRRMDLRFRGVWKMKTGAVQTLQQMLGKIFFSDQTDEFARKLQIDQRDKELIARFFTPLPRLAQLPAAQKQLLLDKLKRIPGVANLRFEQLGDDVYFVTTLMRFPPIPGEGEASPDSEIDSSRGTVDDRITLVLSRSMPAIKEIGQSLGSAGGIAGVCFESEVWSRDFTKDNYIGGIQLQKSARKMESMQFFVPANALVAFGRDEMTPAAIAGRATVKVNGTVVRQPSS